ncbi:DUF948 domain-containing protein [Nitrospira sp. Kam-Ns4a]
MLIEIAAVLAAGAFVVLVALLVPTLIELRRSAAESARLMAELNAELPTLLKEIRSVTENVNDLVDRARDGVERASVLLHAVGEVGETVQQVHGIVRGSSGTMLVNVASVVAGLRAASAVLRRRLQRERGHSDGGQ